IGVRIPEMLRAAAASANLHRCPVPPNTCEPRRVSRTVASAVGRYRYLAAGEASTRASRNWSTARGADQTGSGFVRTSRLVAMRPDAALPAHLPRSTLYRLYSGQR